MRQCNSAYRYTNAKREKAFFVCQIDHGSVLLAKRHKLNVVSSDSDSSQLKCMRLVAMYMSCPIFFRKKVRI